MDAIIYNKLANMGKNHIVDVNGKVYAPIVSNSRTVFSSSENCIASAVSFGNTANAWVIDDTHLYLGGYGSCIKKYLKDDLSFALSTAAYADTVKVIAMDDTYIYVGGNNGVVKKYLKITLVLVATSPAYGSVITSIVVDDTHVYVGGSLGYIKKYLKTTLADTGVSVYVTSSGISCFTTDTTHIYVTTGTLVKKYLKITLVLVATSPAFSYQVFSMIHDGTHLYVGGETAKITKLLMSDLSKILESIELGTSSTSLSQDNDYIYASDINRFGIVKLLKRNLANLYTLTFGSNIYLSKLDLDYVYLVTSNGVIMKYEYFKEIIGYREVL